MDEADGVDDGSSGTASGTAGGTAGGLVVVAAQVGAVRGDVAANMATHLRAIEAAAAHGADLVVFPELSLTGYELDLLSALAMAPDDPVLAPLEDAARAHGLAAVVGAPWARPGGSLPHLGAFLVTPGGTLPYAKVHVHESEAPYVTAGTSVLVADVAGTPTALAVCRDTGVPEHAAEAAARGARLYAAGVMKTVADHPRHVAAMAGHARTHGMAALSAGYAGTSGGDVSAGRSTVWDERGEVVASAGPDREALVVARRTPGGWTGDVVPLSRPGT